MTIKVIASGQSNALGRDTGGPNWSGVSSDVRVWNSINPLGAVGTAWVTAAAAKAAGTFEFTDRNNAFVWFCDKIARAQYEPVDLVVVGRGASGIELWDPTEVTFPMLDQMTNVWAATEQGPADVFLWHQGESNTSDTAVFYHTAFDALLTNLTAAGVIDSSTVIIVGGTAEEFLSRITFNRDSLAAMTRPEYANSYGLTTYDTTHFDAASLTKLGNTRYYSAYVYAKSKGA